MVEKVIVAVDGGAASDAAVEWVIDRARSVDMELEITAVVRFDSELPEGTADVFRGRYDDALARARERVTSAAPNVAVTTFVRRGTPHESLINAGNEADLLVIGSDKPARLPGIMHGTIPLKIAGQARCVTVVVPVKWTPGPGKVVAGWNDDPLAEEALTFAAVEASRTGSELSIVHTWSAAVAPPEAPIAVMEQLVGANRQLLADAARRTADRFPSLNVTHLLQAGSAAVAIVRAAQGASLVVVGSHGRGAVAGFFLGSVSHDVLMNLPAPVAVVPKHPEV